VTFDELFASGAVMAILRGLDPAPAVAVATAAWDAGIDVVEVPVQAPRYLATLRAVTEAAHERGLIVGAGTVTHPDQVAAVAAAGASFTVAPGLDVAISEASVALGMPHLPGVATPTEIQFAMRSGHTWVKAFPASVLGPEWIRSILAPFPDLAIVATGGIDPDNAPAFLAAGARAVAVGSAISAPSDLERLRDRAVSAVTARSEP